ncbi:polysaccharide biosynthesis protein [Candidatus Pelagibacter sp.]|nr:polysaccharide biosynthesis protein [Candidatus Pelagibacter sp.]
MIKNIIFGKRSNLTSSIIKKLKYYEVVSIKNINYQKLKLDNKYKKNYIFNNFYPSFKLNTLKPSQYEKFIDSSIVKLIQILTNLDLNNINKIIYTSSSSVYSLEENLGNTEFDKFNRKIYASFKYSAERIIENFCKQKKIRFYIMRLFNTYGDDNDKFSFIEKLIRIKKNRSKLTLLNNGISLRDFIHIEDVANIYKKFLNNNYSSGIYDIGTGKGKLIKNLVNFVRIDKQNILNLNNISETTKSIANINELQKQVGNYKFKSLDSYLRSKLLINNKKNISSTTIDYPKDKYEGSVIYGSGFAGKKLYFKLKEQKEKIIFFVDDDTKKQNNLLFGIPIISYRDLKKINYKKIIDKVFIAIPSLGESKIKKLNEKLSKSFFDVRYLPEKKFLIDNQINLNDLEIDQINSFISREQIKRKKLLHLKNHNILVTGAAGTIGSEICRQLVFHNANKIVGIDQSEIGIYNIRSKLDTKKVQLLLNNANDKSIIDKIVKDEKITLIIHAAAYKHVNILEENISSAITNNIMLTKNLCEVAKKNNINFILISTDKAAEPSSILGYTKKISEQLVHCYNLNRVSKKFFNIVRFGNVFGSSGSAITKFINQINKNEAITITNKKATRYFMTILEACYLVLSITSIKIKNKTFVLNMGKPINIYQLSKKLSQLKKNVDDTYNFRYIETGLKKNEKLHEILFNKNEKLSKINKNIFYTSRNKFDNEKFTKVFLDFEKNYKKFSKKKATKYLKVLCKI